MNKYVFTLIIFYLLTYFLTKDNISQSADSTLPGIIGDSLLLDRIVRDTPDTSLYILNRKIPNNAFGVGEKLTFTVRYGVIKAGEATMEVKNVESIGDRETFRVLSTAKSARTFDIFFKVRDQVESWIDTQGIFSWKYRKSLREGSYKFDLFVDYDQPAGIAKVEAIRYHNEEPLRIRNQEKFQVEIPPYVLDILTAFYYVRTQNLEVGMPLDLTNHDNKKVYDLRVIIQKKENLQVKAGKFRTIKVQPQLRGDAIFQQKGELWVWLSDDQYKIPVQMKSAIFVGNITTELTRIEGMPLPIPSQIP